MNKIFSLIFLLSISVAHAQQKPNIVYIMADDMGWKDAAFMGSDFYLTPHLDQLAKEGMVFTNAYAGAGNCAPSRACLISGQYTPRHGVYAVYNTKRGPVDQMRLEPIPNSNELAPSVYTIAEALHDGGYKTAIFGKWHLGSRAGTFPRDQGFDVDSSFNPPSEKYFRETNDPKGIYRITNGACAFMEQNKDRPFFLYVSHHATHMPIQVRKDMQDLFDNRAGQLQKNKRFAGMNAQMDDGIGQLLRKIKELGLEDNTLVIFTSDNGGLPQSPQDPLRGFKGMYYEGGIRVPLIAKWPKHIKAGTKQETPIINADMFPTFMEVSGTKIPNTKTLDGKSLLPFFNQPDLKGDQAIFWHFPGYLDNPNPGSRDNVFRSRPVSTVRKGDWKLLLYHEEWVLDGGLAKIENNKSVELYNLKDDLSETKNLASIHKEKRDELLKELMSIMKNTGASMPDTKNPQYKSAAP
ncbi:sulfatase [Niabella insulamsoli]|uniref:sulfatase n=1 Tax=Niabella insulamsoli TaxID=3144874 RepID=UPI0031FDA675